MTDRSLDELKELDMKMIGHTARVFDMLCPWILPEAPVPRSLVHEPVEPGDRESEGDLP